ncbi:MAG: cupin domain-containing protein [Alphaproteobacteria bacterium]
MVDALKLSERPVHLGLGASAEVQPAFTGDMSWYEAYGARHDGDGPEGRLVAQHTFSESWGMWEIHPHGAEVVLCTDGEMTLIQETEDGAQRAIPLKAGDYAVNDAGVWHTADVENEATALFITAGLDTQHRQR